MRVSFAIAILLATSNLAIACDPVPPPVIEIVSNRFYVDAKFSVVDPTLLAKREASLKPLAEASAQFANLSSKAIVGDGASAACLGKALAAWAEAKALLGKMSEVQAEFERKWALAGLAMAYFASMDRIAAADRAVIEPWLDGLAGAVIARYGSRNVQRNNHYYWAAFAIGAVAAGTQNEGLWRRTSDVFDEALRDIGDDGTLPKEMARGSKALHYHHFATLPLVMLAEVAARRGEDWYVRREGRLHRLVRALIDGLSNPGPFERGSGVPQEPKDAAREFTWLPFYGRRFPDRVQPLGRLVRMPFRHRWTGGDMQALAQSWLGK